MGNREDLNDKPAIPAGKTERGAFYAGLFLKNCSGMILLFDEQLCLISCSDACFPGLCGNNTAGLENMPLTEVFSSNLENSWIKKIYMLNGDVLRTLTPSNFNDTIAIKGHEHLHVQVSITPLLNDAGICRGTIMTVTDITDVVEAKLRADKMARSKSSFLANMSHEIRTPMNAVKGLSELLALTELNSLQRNYIKNIIASANSMLVIINDILDFSKTDSNKIEFIEAPYNLADLITAACGMVSMRADEKNLLLLIDASPHLPVSLAGDDMRIKQVVINLLSNAVKYTSNGYVKLTVRAMERSGGVWLQFAVEDSGIGIREEDIDYLFQAFSRVDLLSNRGIAGTGLGLAISKNLASAMGGDIEVQSSYGKGSIFTFSLPQKVVDARPIAELFDPESRRVLLLGTMRMKNLTGMLNSLGVSYTQINTQDTLDITSLSGYTHCISDGSFSERVVRSLCARMPVCLFAELKNLYHTKPGSDYQDTIIYLPAFIGELARFLNKNDRDAANQPLFETTCEDIALLGASVLIVDDNETSLIVGSEILRSFGAEVICAQSGDEAMRLCEDRKFDLIFMDHIMPVKDGIETTREIRGGHGLNRETPVVALTANFVNHMESVFLSNGMDDFIGKPVEMAAICSILCKWLPKEKICTHDAARESDVQETTP